MNYLITGGGGFIGQALYLKLKSENKKVFWTTRKVESNKRDADQIQMDLVNSDSVAKALDQAQPDIIFHLAAQSSVKNSFSDWRNTLHTNYEGSFNLFELVKNKIPSCKVISTGSSAEYGSQARHHSFLSEDLRPLPSSPYGMTKAAQADLVSYFHRTFNLDILHIRPFAVIGSGKKGDFISDLVHRALMVQSGQLQLLEFGDIQRDRDFIDIQDFCNACELLVSKGQAGEVYNVANGLQTTFAEVIDIVCSHLKIKPEIRSVQNELRVSDDQRLVANINKLKSLGYSRSITLQESLERIIEGNSPQGL